MIYVLSALGDSLYGTPDGLSTLPSTTCKVDNSDLVSSIGFCSAYCTVLGSLSCSFFTMNWDETSICIMNRDIPLPAPPVPAAPNSIVVC